MFYGEARLSKLTYSDIHENAKIALDYFYGNRAKNFEFATPQIGNINYILPFKHDEKKHILRIRINHEIFGYEKYIAKEVAAAKLVNARDNGVVDSHIYGEVLADSLREKEGNDLKFEDSADIIFYSHGGGKNLNTPFAIHKYLSDYQSLHDYIGAHSIDENKEIYRNLGKNIAKLHKITLPNCAKDLRDAADTSVSKTQKWQDYFRKNLILEYNKARSFLPQNICLKIKEIIENIGDFSPTARLIHNDLHGDNIFVNSKKDIRLIDWDNWVSDAKERDFVVMKYWTCRNKKGVLDHNQELYEAYVKTYNTYSETALDINLLYYYEFIWLIRLLNYNNSRRNSGLGISKGFPDIEYYTSALSDLC